VWASCGHRLLESEDLGIQILTASYDREGERAYDCEQVCRKCYKMFKRNKLILTHTQAETWLQTGKLPK